MPRAKIEKLLKPPPENRLRKPMAPWLEAWSSNCLTARLSTPGTRMAIPKR